MQRISAAGALLWDAGGLRASAGGPAQESGPQVASRGDGGAHLTWSTATPPTSYDVRAQIVTPAGTLVGSPGGLMLTSSSAPIAMPPVIGVVADGTGGAFYGFWQEVPGLFQPTLRRIAATGDILSNPLQAGPAVPVGYDPQLCSDGAGGALVAFSGPIASQKIYLARLTPGGYALWGSEGITAFSAPGFPQVTGLIGLDGGAILACRIGTTGFARAFDPSGVLLGPPAPGIAIGSGAFEYAGLIAVAGGGITAWGDNRNAGSTGIDVYAQRLDRFGFNGDPAPLLRTVRDVTGDEGGALRVTWAASHLDRVVAGQIVEYEVWRSLPADEAARRERSPGAGAVVAAAVRRPLEFTTDASGAAFAWEFVGEQPAAGDSLYSFVVPTLADSVDATSEPTWVRVRARHGTLAAAWTSGALAAHSRDDLAPPPPAPFAGTWENGVATMTWGASPAADFAAFRLYRGDVPTFTPGPGNRIAVTTSPQFADYSAGGPFIYKVSEVDDNGNESAFATWVPAALVDASGPATAVFALERPRPNPATTSTAIAYSLSATGRADLAVYAASGRHVRTLAAGSHAAGEHRAAFDLRDDAGRRLPAGLYFVRLVAGERRVETRPVVLTPN